MSGAPVVSCAQCPACKTYSPVPSDILKSSPAATDVRFVAISSVDERTPGLARRAKFSYIEPGRTVVTSNNHQNSDYEISWRSKFWKLPVLIHGIVELVLTILIIILEIAALGVSSDRGTGVGLWGSISFLTAAVSTILLVVKWDRSRLWATRVLIAQIVLIIFTLILIGIVGGYVSSEKNVFSLYSTTNISKSVYQTKYQIMQAQLAFGILLLFAGLAYVIFYGVVTYLALWTPHHTLDTPHLFRE